MIVLLISLVITSMVLGIVIERVLIDKFYSLSPFIFILGYSIGLLITEIME